MDWSLRACARKGHLTYAPDEAALRARLQARTPAGEAWRCLRCEAFVVGAPSRSGPADEAPLVLRGKALRDATILRLLAAERGIRGVLVLALAYGVLRFENARMSLQETFQRALPAARPLARVFRVDLDTSATVERLRRLFAEQPHTLNLIALALLGYGLLELLEAIGLALLRRWGEYVAAVGTAVFLPLELHELANKVTVLRVVAFVVNLAAVAYLLVTKRLFGLRGGKAAYTAERESASLLEVERSAGEAGGVSP